MPQQLGHRLFAGIAILGLLTSGWLAAQEADPPKDQSTAEKPADGTATAAKTREVVVSPPGMEGGLKLQVPETWKQAEPQSRLRLAEFQVPAAEGDTQPVELAVFSFGGGGGGVQANIQRWIGQFNAEGRKQQILIGKAEQGQYVFVDISGTYNMPDGPPILQKTKPLPDARMLAVIIGTEKNVFYLKMTGTAKSVTPQLENFRNAFGADKSTEQEPKTRPAEEETEQP
jgi:gluconolactonase